MARFQGLDDTDPRAAEVLARLYRDVSESEKAALAFQMLAMSMSLAEDGVRLDYPDAGPREVRLRAAARLYGNDLVRRAFGWDPECHDRPDPGI
jgi:hypothetical protein